MGIVVQKKRWGYKPHVGTQVDLGHPFAQGLTGAWLFNEYGGLNLKNLVQNKTDGTLTELNWKHSQSSGVYIPATNLVTGGTDHIKGNGAVFLQYQNVGTPTSNGKFCLAGGSNWQLFRDASDTASRLQISAQDAFFTHVNIYDGVPHTLSFSWDPDADIRKMWVDGVKSADSTVAFNFSGESVDPIQIGNVTALDRTIEGIISFFFIWDRILTETQHYAMHVVPYDFLIPQVPRYRFFASPPLGGVDTREKRMSAASLLLPFMTPGIEPSTIDQAERQAASWVYSGILAQATGPVGQPFTLRQWGIPTAKMTAGQRGGWN